MGAGARSRCMRIGACTALWTSVGLGCAWPFKRNHWTNLREARGVIGDFKHEYNHRHRFPVTLRSATVVSCLTTVDRDDG